MAKRAKKNARSGGTPNGRKVARKRRPRAPRLASLGIGQLRAILEAKEACVGKLLARRDKLLAEVDRINGEIRDIRGVGRPGRKPGLNPGPKPGRKPGRPAKAATRAPRGGATLGNKIAELLGAAGRPLRLLELLSAVRKSDYPSRSKHLRSMVSQTLRRDSRFRKVRRGTYTLAK